MIANSPVIGPEVELALNPGRSRIQAVPGRTLPNADYRPSGGRWADGAELLPGSASASRRPDRRLT
jgi:hypothetical protein